MNQPVFIFFVIVGAIAAFTGWFFRGALFSVSSTAAEHAKIYAVAYITGGSLILIAAIQALASAWMLLPDEMKSAMPWVPYVIFFLSPIQAGLAVLVAFLNRSTQRAGEEAAKKNSVPPFPKGTTAPLSPQNS